MHPSLIFPALLLSLPFAFAIPTPQNGAGTGLGDDANGTIPTATTQEDESYFADPYVDRPISSESAAAVLKDQYEDYEDAVEASKNYTPVPLTPEEQAAEQELLEYWSTASFPTPTGTDDYYIYPTGTDGVYDDFYGDLGAYATGTDYPALPKTTDPCGPDAQDGTELNTCLRDPDGTTNTDGSAFVHYSGEPAAYGVTCMAVPGTTPPSPSALAATFADAPTRTTTGALNVTACHFKEFCASIGNAPTDQWVWNSWSPGCALAMWLPSDPSAADRPEPERCEYGILRTMAGYCDVGDGLDVATVNVKELQGGGGSGSQVNAGYASFLVSPEVLTTL
ncbi:MAG: hypothetical protein Q9169_007014 [Polycauliona sp. 2 TL-2023]